MAPLVSLASGIDALTGPLTTPLTGPLTALLVLATGTGPLVGPLAALLVRSCGTAWPASPTGAAIDCPRRDGSGGRRRAHAVQ
jgi:hypothetical protein